MNVRHYVRKLFIYPLQSCTIGIIVKVYRVLAIISEHLKAKESEVIAISYNDIRSRT